MIYDVIARDGASSIFKKMGAEADGASRSFDRLGKAAAGIAIIGAAAAVKMAADFQKNTNVLVTSAGESQKNLKLIRNGILDIAVATGTSNKSITDSVYVAEKAGYRAADALKIAKAAAQGAKEENADNGVVTNALTSILASYHLKASDAVAVTDELKTAAGESKTNFQDFSNSLSTVLPIASSLKVNFADVAGALATLTQHGTTADESTQELAGTLRGLASPNAVAIAEAQKLGISFTDVSNKIGDGPGGRGLVGTLQYLYTTVQKSLGPSGDVILKTFNNSKLAAADAQTEFNHLSPAVQSLAKQFENGSLSSYQYTKDLRSIGGEQSVLGKQFLATYGTAHGFQQELKTGGTAVQTADQAIRKLTGGALGLNTVLQIAGPNFDATVARSKKVGEAAKDAGKDVSGWASTSQLFSTKLGQVSQEIAKLAIELGTQLLPPLESVLSVLAKHPAILEAAAAAVALLGARYAAVKFLSIANSVATLTARLLGLGLASKAAAGEEGIAGLTTGAYDLERGFGAAEGASSKATLGITGIGTAISRISALAGLTAVAGALVSWAQAAGKARQQIDAIEKSTITNQLDPAQLNAAASQIEAKVDAAQNRTSSFGGVLRGAINTVDFGATGQSGLTDDAIEKQGANAVIQLKGQAEATAEAIQQLHNSYGLTVDNIQQLVKAGGIKFNADFSSIGKGEAAFKSLYGAQLDALPVSARAAAAITGEGSAASKSSDEIKALAGVVNGLIGKNASALQATDQFHQGLNDLSQAIDGTSKATTGSTDAAITNRTALTNLIISAAGAAQAYANSTGKTGDYTKSLNLAIPAIESAAEAQGFSKKQVDALINSLGLIPPTKSTAISTPGVDDSTTKVKNLADQLSRIQSKAVTVAINAAGNAAASVLGGSGFFSGSASNGIPSGIIQADGGIHPHGVPGGVYQWAEAGGEAFIPLSPAKRSRSLDLWAKTGRMLGVQGMANGGITIAENFAIRVQDSDVANYLKALAKNQTDIAKIGVKLAEKTTTTDIKAGAAAIAASLKDGNGPLQTYIAALLKNAQGNLYSVATAAVRNGSVSPAEQAAIAKAAAKVTDLTGTLTKLNTTFTKTATGLTSFVQAQQQYASSLKGTLSQGNTLSDVLSQSGTVGDIKTLLAGKVSNLKAFIGKLSSLKKLGWPDALVREIAGDGVDTGNQYVDLLLSASKADRASLIGATNLLYGNQTSGANLTTLLTGGTGGLTNAPAIKSLNNAIFSPGANVPYWVNQAAQQQTNAPALHVENQNIYSNTDLELVAKQALFLQQAGHFT